MAQVTLNPAINGLDTSSTLYELYTRFYDGMTDANNNDTPDFVASPIYEMNEDGSYKLDEDGALIVDTVAMDEKMKEYSTILVKNSAYMMANAIVSTIFSGGSGGSSGGLGFVSRSGDTMQGTLGALYGFEAGYNNTKIFETTIDASDRKLAIVSGNLQVSEDADILGKLNLSNSGIYFGGNQTIWYDQSALHISSQDIDLTGDVVVSGSIQIGDFKIDESGMSLGKYEYYHSGNSNKDDVDWTMCNGYVKGSLYVDGTSELRGTLTSTGGFAFEVSEHSMLYSQTKDGVLPYVVLNSDLSIINNHGIKFNDDYIIWVRSTDKIVSFSAPGAVMNLGDKSTDDDGNDVTTQYISLQSDIKNYNGAYTIVARDGSGNFPNGFSAGAANALGATFQTYTIGSSDYGVISKKNMRFGSISGPSLASDGTVMNVTMPYSYVSNEAQQNTTKELSIRVESSNSLVYNPTSDQATVAMCFDTEASHFSFSVPIEAEKFSVKSSQYKTSLEENVLFFDDEVFIEGITSGMRLSGNSMFDNNLYSYDADTSSVSFSSGFAGKGWAIMEDTTAGGVHATFDSLTIRKKMRVYELEVQKISVTNGSLWVSDSCSGDEVRELT